jgi:hypothetical protein
LLVTDKLRSCAAAFLSGTCSRLLATARGSQLGETHLKAIFRLLLQKDSDGTAIGTDNIRLLLTLGPGHSKLTGTFESQIKNTAGSVLLEVTGTFSAIRITV